jgi:hypothetical protein
MQTQNAQQLMAGFAMFTTPDEVAASPVEGESISITVSPISSQACASVIGVSVVATVDAGC